MGFLTWWSNLRTDLHRPTENTRQTLRRLGRTPPEFWSGKDWMASRRLRYQRKVALDHARKNGLSIARVMQDFPEGRYWPDTPQYNRQFLDGVMGMRELMTMNEEEAAMGGGNW